MSAWTQGLLLISGFLMGLSTGISVGLWVAA